MDKELLEVDWKVGDQFTSPETGDKVFTVKEVEKFDVIARDSRSRSGDTRFLKSYITKVKENNVASTSNTDETSVASHSSTFCNSIERWKQMLVEYENLRGMEENNFEWNINILRETYYLLNKEQGDAVSDTRNDASSTKPTTKTLNYKLKTALLSVLPLKKLKFLQHG